LFERRREGLILGGAAFQRCDNWPDFSFGFSRCGQIPGLALGFLCGYDSSRSWEKPATLIRFLAMDDLNHLFENNRRWVAQMTAKDPGFFQRLSRQQKPQYLWIGCADSRVPANEIVDLLPGELFVHRNVSNVVALDDINCLSVIQYAVDVLQVRHIIVCGHFGCGGVEAALEDRSLGLSDAWLKRVREVRDKHREQLDALKKVVRWRRLCELNVIEQVCNVVQTSTVQEAWSRQQKVSIHGWIYAIDDGLLRDLRVSIARPEEAAQQYDAALKNLAA
jgi:carbonic anhydrase